MEEKTISNEQPTLGKNTNGKQAIYLSIAVILVIGHFIFLFSHFEPGISGPDTHGYFKQAELIANHGRTWFDLDSPLQYTNFHWLKTDENRFYSRYPAGFPLILAIVYKLGGPSAAMLVNPILTSLSLLGLYLLCRLWIGGVWGLVAVLVMAINSVANVHAFWGGSHPAIAFFLIWGLYLLARWSDRPSMQLALLAGLCLGMIPTIRYAETLFGVGAGLFLVLHWNLGAKYIKTSIAAMAGASIPIFCMLINNKISLGTFTTSAYDLGHPLFTWQYFKDHAVSYIDMILSTGAGFFGPLGLLGITILCTRRETWRIGVLFAAILLPITLLYMAYYFGTGDRFLLPTFYLYAIAGVWLLKMISEFHSKGAYAATVVIVALTAVCDLPDSIRSLSRFQYSNGATATMGQAASEYIEPGSIVIAAQSIHQQLDYLGQWRLADESFLDSRNMRRMRDRSTAPLKDLDVWRTPDRSIYWIGNKDDIEDRIPEEDQYEVVAEIDLRQPEPENDSSRHERMGRGGKGRNQRGGPGMMPGGPMSGMVRGGMRPGGMRPGDMGLDNMGPRGMRPGDMGPGGRPGMDVRMRGMRGGRGGRPGGGGPGGMFSVPSGKLAIVKWTRSSES